MRYHLLEATKEDELLNKTMIRRRRSLIVVVVVVEPKDQESLGLDPGEGPNLDLDGIDQGRPGEADRTLDLVRADSRAEAEVPDPKAAKIGAATTTTTAGRTRMRRRTAPPRTLAKVRILSSPLPLPLWKLWVLHSLLLLLSCC